MSIWDDDYDDGFSDAQGKGDFFGMLFPQNARNIIKKDIAYKQGFRDGTAELEDEVENELSFEDDND